MGRHNGSWSPVYGQVWDHVKTRRAASYLVKHDRRIPEDLARFAVVGMLNRLCLWCLAVSEDGRTGALDDTRIATIAWPEALGRRSAAVVGALVRGALREGGYLEDGPSGEGIHDFADHHARILKERRRKRDDHDRDDEVPGGGAEPSAEASAATGTGTGTGNGTGNGTGRGPPPSPRGEPAPAAPPRVAAQRRSASPQEALARDLATRLGSSLRPCQAQVRALRAEGWDLERIAAAVEDHAVAGVAPWDWTKLAKGTTAPPRHGGLTGEQIRRMTERPPRPDLPGLGAGGAR